MLLIYYIKAYLELVSKLLQNILLSSIQYPFDSLLFFVFASIKI